MRFVYDGRPWQLAARVPNWAGDTAAVGSGLPEGVVLACASDTKARVFRLFGWTPEQGDYLLTIPFSQVQAEPGTVYPTGRLDPMGLPAITLHGGMVKIWVRLWDGGTGQGAPLARLYTWVYLIP